MKKGICLLLFIFISVQARAYFQFNENCNHAYSLILELRLKEARALILKEKISNPGNSIVLLLDNYCDYFSLLASDSQTEFETIKKSVPARLESLDKADKNSPWYYYSEAEINLQFAFMRARYQEYWGAAWAIRRASYLLDENLQHYPDFLPAKKSKGILLALLGSVPAGLRMAMAPFGIHGNTSEGLNLLENTLQKMRNGNFSYMGTETALYLSYIETAISDNPDLYSHSLQRLSDSPLVSPLNTYVKSTIAIHYAHTSDAIKFLSEKPSGKEYVNFFQLDYLMGIAKLNRLDSDAISWFRRFLGETRGENFIKDSYLRLAWIYFLAGNKSVYNENIKKVIQKGSTYTEKDKQALKDAGTQINSTSLLKARLLFDGGFFEQAKNELHDKSSASFPSFRDRLEFFYRSGRIAEALGKNNEAITWYTKTVSDGEKEPWYFAANASLHLGIIYEKIKDLNKAKSAYKACLEMREAEYKSSIDNKARNALERLKK